MKFRDYLLLSEAMFAPPVTHDIHGLEKIIKASKEDPTGWYSLTAAGDTDERYFVYGGKIARGGANTSLDLQKGGFKLRNNKNTYYSGHKIKKEYK